MEKRQNKRYWSKVNKRKTNECWPWIGYKDLKGYGRFYITDKTRPTGMRLIPAHRYAYLLYNKEMPANMVVDHICFTRECQNPRHLRVLTALENSQTANRKPITHCPRGHEYTQENIKYRYGTSGKQCRICRTKYVREWSRKHRQQLKAVV